VLGVLLLHDMSRARLVMWLAPMAASLGLLGVAAVVLEVPKTQVRVQGGQSKGEGRNAGNGLETEAILQSVEGWEGAQAQL
jgi:hypothetical protein